MEPIRRSLLAPVAGVAVVLLLGAAGLHRAAQAGESAEVPELPSIEERADGLYDDDGCLRSAAGDQDCSITADEIDQALAGDSEDDTRHLSGFTGSLWTEDVAAGEPVVLAETVTMATGDEIQITGLVRNESESKLDSIAVTATLHDADGNVLGELTGPAAVGSVRSGEPVPFILSGPEPAAEVATVGWVAVAADTDEVSRDFEWQTYWEQPAGGREPLDIDFYREEGPGPHPHVVFGSVRNIGPGAASNVEVVTAWIDADGRVAAISRSAALDPAGAATPVLESDAAADALLVDDNVPVEAEALTWVSST